jgi:hypothetical protein
LLFQIIAGRAETAAVIATANLPNILAVLKQEERS